MGLSWSRRMSFGRLVNWPLQYIATGSSLVFRDVYLGFFLSLAPNCFDYETWMPCVNGLRFRWHCARDAVSFYLEGACCALTFSCTFREVAF